MHVGSYTPLQLSVHPLNSLILVATCLYSLHPEHNNLPYMYSSLYGSETLDLFRNNCL